MSYGILAPAISIHPPRAGRDYSVHIPSFDILLFQSTRPVRGGTVPFGYDTYGTGISIHPPRAGRDVGKQTPVHYESVFQSTRPVRGGTSSGIRGRMFGSGFQSTRPVRGGTAISHKIAFAIYCTIYNNAPANPTWQHILQPCGIFFFAMRIKIRCEVRGVFPGASPSHGQIIRTPSGLYPAFTPKCSVFVS